MKQPDPHEEALMILKGQMSHTAAVAVAPGTQVRGRVWLCPECKTKWGLPGSLRHQLPQKVWPCCFSLRGAHLGPLSTLFGMGTGAQGGCGPGEASDQCTEAIHGAHSR